MPRIRLEDLDDPRIAVYRHLKADRQRSWADRFVVEGDLLVTRLAASRFPLVSVLVAEGSEERLPAELAPDVPIYVTEKALLDGLVGFSFHRGILACGLRLPWSSWSNVLTGMVTATQPMTVVICPHLEDPDNLGSIVRTADALGVALILVGPRCPDPLSRRVLRVSMGATLRLPVLGPIDLPSAVADLRSTHGFRTFAAVASGRSAEPIGRIEPPLRSALLLGNEREGLDSEWLTRADSLVTIPMRPGADSLNVGVAAGILLARLAPAGHPNLDRSDPAG